MASITNNNANRLVAILFIVAFLLRLAVVWIHPTTDLPDSRDYNTLAAEILHGQPYQVTDIWGQHAIASRMPGYPIFIAGIYAVAGEHPSAVLMLQALLGAACVPMVFFLASRISVMAGLLAAFAVTIDPLGVLFSASLLTEVPFTFALLAIVVLVVKIPNTKRWLLAALGAALLSGCAIYLRASALWLLLLLPLIVFVQQPRRALCTFVLTIVIVGLMLMPWQYRNRARLDMGYLQFTTLEGISLYEAVYPQATGGPMQDKISLPPEMVPLNEVQRDAEWNRRAWQYIHDDPARIIHLAFIKFGRTWSPWLNAAEYQIPVVNVLLTLWHVPIYVLAIFGIFRRRIPAMLRLAMLLPIIYFSLVHSLFLGSVRYRVPLMPLVYIFAAIPLASLIEKHLAARKPTNSPSK